MAGASQLGQNVVALSSAGGQIEMNRSKNTKPFGKSLINPRPTQKELGVIGNVDAIGHNMSMDDGQQPIHPLDQARKSSKIGRRSQTTHEQSHEESQFIPSINQGPAHHATTAAPSQSQPSTYDQKLLRA